TRVSEVLSVRLRRSRLPSLSSVRSVSVSLLHRRALLGCLRRVGSVDGLGRPRPLPREVQWPSEWPYTPEDFRRQETNRRTRCSTSSLASASTSRRFISALRDHYASTFSKYPGARILDRSSAPAGSAITRMRRPASPDPCVHHRDERVRAAEQQAGRRHYTVRNLNVVPELPYDTESFDIVTCTVSDWGGPEQASRGHARGLEGPQAGWPCHPLHEQPLLPVQGGSDLVADGRHRALPHIWNYIHYAGGFGPPEALDLGGPLARLGMDDPVFVIQARRVP
ncbi:unnamed protein product, partial [Prorocentrum cordatum]